MWWSEFQSYDTTFGCFYVSVSLHIPEDIFRCHFIDRIFWLVSFSGAMTIQWWFMLMQEGTFYVPVSFMPNLVDACLLFYVTFLSFRQKSNLNEWIVRIDWKMRVFYYLSRCICVCVCACEYRLIQIIHVTQLCTNPIWFVMLPRRKWTGVIKVICFGSFFYFFLFLFLSPNMVNCWVDLLHIYNNDNGNIR